MRGIANFPDTLVPGGLSLAWREGIYEPTVLDDPFPLEELKGPYAFPQLAGLRLRGANLVPRPTDTGNGDTNPITPANFYDLFYDLGTNGATDVAWTRWLKPQIDAAAAIGLNCLRIICQPTVRVGDASHHGPETFRGTITNGQLQSAYDTIITYCAGKGIYFYPALMEAASVDTLTTAQILQFVDEATAIVSSASYTNVLGIDVVQECDRSAWAMTPTNLAQAHTHARAALVKKIPITSSVSGNVTALFVAPPIIASAGVDFFDFHTYLYTNTIWLNLVSPNFWRLPIITGETGIAYNGFFFDHPGTPAQETTRPFSSELRARHYQNVSAGFGKRYDQQATIVWGMTKEWPADDLDMGLVSDAQNASFAFTTQRPEWVGPLQTVPITEQPHTAVHVLDLTGPDTTNAAYTAVQTYTLGWGQIDYANVFSRSSNRVKRANSSLAKGLINFFGMPSTDHAISVDFDAAQAVPSGGEIDWAVSLRHQGSAPFTLDLDRYYFVNVTSKPGDQTADGAFSIWKVDTTFTLLTSGVAQRPFDRTHKYRLTAAATGTWPTTLTATLTDLTTSTPLLTLGTVDSAARLQSVGHCGLPCQIGEVYYTNVQYTQTGHPGPSVLVPTMTTATATTLAISWQGATGGTAPYRYRVEYSPVDSNGFPTLVTWSALPTQTATTATITGLTTNTRYAVRVRVVDNGGN